MKILFLLSIVFILAGCASNIEKPCGNLYREYSLVETVDPVYPKEQLEAGIEGWVIVELTISEVGKAENLSVHDASPATIFDDSALAAVEEFVFNPRIANCVPVKLDGVRFKVSFNLEKNEDWEKYKESQSN